MTASSSQLLERRSKARYIGVYRGPRQVPRTSFFYHFDEGVAAVAKVSPGEFIRQVRLEGINRVVWPSRKETITTAIMVLIMTTMLALFFFGIDSFFGAIVSFLLNLIA